MGETSGLLLVLQTPKAGREDDHSEWYVSNHLPDVCGVPGAVRGEYLAAVPLAGEPKWSNAAAYWLDSPPAPFVDEVFRRAGSGEWTMSDTLDPANTLMTIAVPITPRVRSADEADVAPSDRLVFIVLTNPVAGCEDEYNDWYTNQHLGDVLAVPGFVAAQRFKFAEHPALKGNPYAYVALYEVRADVVEAAFADLSSRSGTDAMVLSPALSSDVIAMVAAKPIGIVGA